MPSSTTSTPASKPSRAHDLLTQTAWESASLADVVRQTVGLHATGPDAPNRIEVTGPPVRLNPNAAVTLNMAFHELALNAAKYGALSVPEGQVSVRWAVERDGSETSVRLCWRERNGPSLAPPERRGFGSRLLERGLTGEMGGTVTLHFEPMGLECHMRLPLSAKVRAER